ncbi:MAG: N-acetylmuramoyl-L-alanine amidase, partial [Pseudomonadota bacterium]
MTRVASAVSRPSPNHDARPLHVAVDMLVLHYTGLRTCAAALDRLCDSAAKV